MQEEPSAVGTNRVRGAEGVCEWKWTNAQLPGASRRGSPSVKALNNTY